MKTMNLLYNSNLFTFSSTAYVNL